MAVDFLEYACVLNLGPYMATGMGVMTNMT